MKEISAEDITSVIRRLCMEANSYLPDDIKGKIATCRMTETWNLAKNILGVIEENFSVAENDFVPICQDTGVACVFLEIGQDVHINGNLREAVDEGVRQGYTDGYLRKSVVKDPLDRVNTGDNTPAMLYTEIVPGDELKITVAPKGFGSENMSAIKITVAPKGFGSENMSAIKMLKPSDGIEGVKKFILETVENAGPNPCPPIVVGVGIGGTFDKAALLAKKALMRSTDVRNEDKLYADLEEEMLEKINALGIGPQGVGGATTALAVNIEKMPTHIAGLPVAVNINCHVARHRSAVL